MSQYERRTMQRLLILLFLAIIATGCEPECLSSPSCVAPPDGVFQEGKTNVAISPNILEEVVANSFQEFAMLDSAVVRTSDGDFTIRQFYYWIAVGENAIITAVDFYYGENTTSILKEDFVFGNSEQTFTNGGYFLGAIKEGANFALRVEPASQDLIDGICNDTFDC
ncbi:MAG: hypothetical protein ABJP45_03270 [Cyclobacteriaceae bacterium]